MTSPTPCALRVLIVGPSLRIVGGQSVQAAIILENLRREPGVEVSFLPINPALPGPLGALQKIKYVRTLVTLPAYCAALLARVRSCDVVHAFSASYSSFLLAPAPAILAAKLYRRKIVLNYHSGEAEDHLARSRRTALPLIRLADSVAVPSGYLAGVFAKFGFAAHVVSNVVETGRFRFRERRPLEPVFLANRNLEPMYNVGCVLRAFEIIRNRIPGARLLVAGEGSERPRLEALRDALGLRGVEFTGRIAPAAMPELYDRAGVFLNGSDIDNMPMSILEAYASGLPVVTTDAGGIPYMVEDGRTGLLVPRGDYRAMAARAISLFEDDSLAWRLVHNARQECSRYQWDAVRDGWLNLYEALVRGPAKSEPAGAPRTRGAAAGGAAGRP
jgi:glycosyltransferase involved in cell wall biosynthesis